MSMAQSNLPLQRDRHQGQDREKIPRLMLLCMLGLVLTTLLIVTWARLTDQPLVATPPDVPIAQSIEIQLAAQTDGSAIIRDGDGRVLADLASNEGGFVAGVWRALTFERGKHRVDPDAPVLLVRYADGRLALTDDQIGWHAELRAFGIKNAEVFAQLLED